MNHESDSTANLVAVTETVFLTPEQYEEYKEISNIMAEETIMNTPDPEPRGYLYSIESADGKSHVFIHSSGHVSAWEPFLGLWVGEEKAPRERRAEILRKARAAGHSVTKQVYSH